MLLKELKSIKQKSTTNLVEAITELLLFAKISARSEDFIVAFLSQQAVGCCSHFSSSYFSNTLSKKKIAPHRQAKGAKYSIFRATLQQLGAGKEEF